MTLVKWGINRAVDREDFGYFQACLSGSGQPAGPRCEDADLQADGDVDPIGFGAFLTCVGGANQPPGG